MKPASLREEWTAALPRRGTGAFSASRVGGLWRFLQDLAELTKLRVALLVLLTTAAGFVVGSRVAGRASEPLALAWTLLGTALVAGGAAAWNQVLERDRDARMLRTRERPLPAGRMPLGVAWAIGGLAVVSGLLLLGTAVNPLAAGLAAFTFLSYVFLYTPLKAKTHLATPVGAVPGALPPLIGWAGATGQIDGAAWVLFGILFLWQLPHFLAIAWLHREDYARGGYPMLTVVDPSGVAAARQVVANSVALVPASLLPAVMRMGGPVYLVCALILAGCFVALAVWLAVRRSRLAARALVLGSVLYLPLLLMALVADGAPFGP